MQRYAAAFLEQVETTLGPDSSMYRYEQFTSYSRYVDFKRLRFIVEIVTERFRPSADVVGFDLGCGKGDITLPLASLGYRMAGADISSQAIAIASERAARFFDPSISPRFKVIDAESLDHEHGSFDFVICSEVLEHLTHPESALNAIQSSYLKEGGILIATVPNGYGPYSLLHDHYMIHMIAFKLGLAGQVAGHVQSFTFGRIKSLLKETGFEILRVKNSDFTSFLPHVVAFKKICVIDCALADWLPHRLVSGWYIVCQKRGQP